MDTRQQPQHVPQQQEVGDDRRRVPGDAQQHRPHPALGGADLLGEPADGPDGERRTGEGDQAGDAQADEHRQVLELEQHGVARVLLQVPHGPQGLAQRPGPAHTGDQQQHGRDHADGPRVVHQRPQVQLVGDAGDLLGDRALHLVHPVGREHRGSDGGGEREHREERDEAGEGDGGGQPGPLVLVEVPVDVPDAGGEEPPGGRTDERQAGEPVHSPRLTRLRVDHAHPLGAGRPQREVAGGRLRPACCGKLAIGLRSAKGNSRSRRHTQSVPCA
jgi:hypothetical protein